MTVALMSGTRAGVEVAWGKITGATVAGDLLWVDWTTNGGTTWLQCGPVAVTAPNQTKTTAAHEVGATSSFRACGRRSPQASSCTSWW